VALKLECNVRGIKVGMLALVSFYDGAKLVGQLQCSNGREGEEFPVLVDPVEMVDEEKRTVERVRSLVRLKRFDQIQDPEIIDSLYFSSVRGTTFFLDRLFHENREFDLPPVLFPIPCAGESPDNMIEARSQMVDDLSSQGAEAGWHGAVLLVIDRLKENLAAVLGQDRMFAFFKEQQDFGVQITDVLFGPY